MAPPRDCATVIHEARVQCQGKKGREHDACVLAMGLRTHSDDPKNECVCRIDGYSKPYYLPLSGCNGQTQHVHGMPCRGAPSRMVSPFAHGTSENLSTLRVSASTPEKTSTHA